MKNNQWHDFNEGVWQEQISVRDFILNNYTPFDEAPEFLQDLRIGPKGSMMSTKAFVSRNSTRVVSLMWIRRRYLRC